MKEVYLIPGDPKYVESMQQLEQVKPLNPFYSPSRKYFVFYALMSCLITDRKMSCGHPMV